MDIGLSVRILETFGRMEEEFIEEIVVDRRMQHVRLSSHQTPVIKLGDSQMTLTPKFRLTGVQSCSFSPLNSESVTLVDGGPLLPGLPDDIALDCLLRLPVESLKVGKLVCKRWHLLLGSKERFFRRRKELGYQDPWLFVFAFHKHMEKMEWQVLDLNNLSWHTIPPMPCKGKVSPHGFRCVAFPEEGVLFVCGGMISEYDRPLDQVLKYEIRKNRWSVMNRMISARTFFAMGMIDGLVYVAGGNSSDLLELDKAEAFDPNKGEWRSIASIKANMASYDAAVLNGKLLVTEGWLWPFLSSPRGKIYDPKHNSWETMPAGMREGWTGLSAVVNGYLFVVSEHENLRLKVYDMETDSWETVAGYPIPDDVCKPSSVSSYDCKICVVSCNLVVAIGHLWKLNVTTSTGKDWSFIVQWQLVEPEDFCGWSPSSAHILIS